jgi:hypothetical protein
MPALPPPPAFNANISIVRPTRPGVARATNNPKPNATSNGTSKAADAQKHGFFHFLHKGKKDKTKGNNAH